MKSKRIITILIAFLLTFSGMAGSADFSKSADLVYAAESIAEQDVNELPDLSEAEPTKKIGDLRIYDVDDVREPEETVYSDEVADIVESSKGASSVTARDWYSYSSRYYYQKMTASEKKLYADMYRYCIYMLTTVSANRQEPANYSASVVQIGNSYYSECISKRFNYGTYGVSLYDVEYVWMAFVYENPQFYFIDANLLRYQDGFVLVFYDLFMDSSYRAGITNDLFNRVDSWAAGVKTESGQFAQLVKAQKYVMDFNIYKFSVSDLKMSEYYDQSLYSSAYMGKTVCAGYSKAMVALLRKAGFQAIPVTSKTHAWNMVKVGYNWYNLDSTWDDEVLTYPVESKIDVTKYPNGFFFLVSDKNLAKDDVGRNASAHTATPMWTTYGKPVSLQDYSMAGCINPSNTQNAHAENDVKSDFAGKYYPEVAPTISLNKKRFIYSGGKAAVSFTVTAAGKIINPADYWVSYNGNLTNVGYHDITVNLRNSSGYSGAAKETITIVPKKTSIKKLKPGNRRIEVKVKKIGKQVSGYQIQYSLKKNFKGKKTAWLKGYKKTSKKLTGLKKGRVYYVRVRTYKNYYGEKIYSDWATKKVKVK